MTEDGRVVYLDPSAQPHGIWLDSWDCSFKSTAATEGSWVVGQRWVRVGADRFLVGQQRGRWSFTQTIASMRQWCEASSLYGTYVHERLIESAANGPAIIDTLREEISGLKPIIASVSKEARARAVTPEVESGNVYLPHPADPGNEWVGDFLSELRNFPNDIADDQVDALTQALTGLRTAGRGNVVVPGGRQGLPTLRRSRAQSAASDNARRVLAPKFGVK